MRTTLTLDADVAEGLRCLMAERDVSFKEAVNSALRLGLRGQSPRPRIKLETEHMGVPLIPLDHALRVAAAMEDEAIIEKLRQGR